MPSGSPPTAVADSYSVIHDRTLNVSASGLLANDTDPENDTLSASLVSNPSHGSVTLNSNGSFTFNPASGYVGTDSFQYKAFDGTGFSSAVTVSLSITNNVPSASNDSYTLVGSALSVSAAGVQANDSDADGDTLLSSVVSGPSHGSLTLGSNGGFTFTPNSTFTGTDSFSYKDNDHAADSNTATVSITGHAPVASDDAYTLHGGSLTASASAGVLSNDSDADGGTLTVSVVSNVSHGSLTLNSDGSFSFTPNSGFTGTDSFSYKISDGFFQSNTATVSITGHAPVGSNDSYTLHGSSLTVSASGVLGNDTDADSDTLSASLVAGPSHGSLSLNSNGSFTFTPNSSFTGADSFSYKAFDGFFYSSTTTVSITGNAPSASNDSYTLHGSSLTVSPAGILSNDTDPDGDTLSASLVSGPSHGSLTLNGNGSFTFTPASGFTGTDSFTYKASDGFFQSNTATVSITGHAPSGTADSYDVHQGQTLTISAASGVLANDTDADGDTLSTSLVSGVSHGSLTLNSNGSFSYTPTAGYSGNDSFAYKASDGFLLSSSITVSIHVNDAAPVADDDAFEVLENHTLTVTTPGVLDNDTDSDNDTLTVSVASNVSHGSLTLNSNGSFSYTPSSHYAGEDSFTYTVNDGAKTDTTTVTITVIDVTPIIEYLVVPPESNEGRTVTFYARASDYSGGSLTYAWDFGDGTTETDTDLTAVTHFYVYDLSSETFTVTLTVSNDLDSASLERDISIANLPPQVDAGPNQQVHAGDSVTFSGTLTDAGDLVDTDSIRWDFDYDGSTFNPDGAADGLLSPSHTYTTPGTYVVAMQAADAGDLTGFSLTSVIVKEANALLVNAGDDQDITVGDTVSFSGDYSFPGGSVDSSDIEWDFNYDGSTFNPTTSGSLTPEHVFDEPGTYQVALRITGSDGSSDISLLEIRAAYHYTGPTADAGEDLTITQGDTAELDGSYTDPDGSVSSSGIEWDYDYDGAHFTADASGSLSPSWDVLSSGTHQVALRVTDEHGLSSIDVLEVTVENVAPTVSMTNTSLTVTVGDTVLLSATVSDPGGADDPVSVCWDFDYDGTTFNPTQATGDSAYHTFLSTGSHTVAARALDSAGAETIETMSVTVQSASTLVVDAGDDAALMQGDAVDFDGSYTDPNGTVSLSSVDWDFDYDGSTFTADSSAHGTLTPEHEFLTPGSYLVGLRITDSNSVTQIGVLHVTVLDLAPEVNAGDEDFTIDEGDSVDFDGTATDAGGSGDIDTVEWDFNYDGRYFNADSSATGDLTPSHTFTTAGEYEVALRATDLWGAATISTVHVEVAAVAPTATVTATDTVEEGTAAVFTVSDLSDPDPDETFTYLARWQAGDDFQLLDPEDFTELTGGGLRFSHLYDDDSGVSDFEATVRVMDGDGAYTDYEMSVEVTNAAPSATFGPSGGFTLVAGDLPILFSDVADPSGADSVAGFTYHYRVNGGDYVTSSSPVFVLSDYTPDTVYTVDGYVEDKDGGTSDVYTATVTTGDEWTVFANRGTGSVLLNDSITVGANEYYLYSGLESDLHVTLLDSEASYQLYTNGSFALIDVDTGVASVYVGVFTDVDDATFLADLDPASGSATASDPIAFYGYGNVGAIILPGRVTNGEASELEVHARGDLGSVSGPGTTGKQWAEAADLVFGNLTGSITGLDQVGSIQARGWLGDEASDLVWANEGIGSLSAYGVAATVTGDRNYNQSDLATEISIRHFRK